MTVPLLPVAPGADDIIGPNLAKLVDLIGSKINPTAKYDEALKQLFLEKPELMQKFVDVEKENPGTLKAFGFGEGATDFVSGMKQSIPSIKEGLGRAELAKGGESARSAGTQAATGLTPAQQVGEQLQEYMLKGGLDLMKTDPASFNRGVRNILKLPTDQELKVEADTMAAYDKGKAMADRSIPEIVQGITAGTIKNTEISGGLLHPAAQAGVKAALHQYQQDRESATAVEIAKIRTADHTPGEAKGDVSIVRAQMNAAADQYKASKGIAPVNAFYQNMWGTPMPGYASASTEELKKVDDFNGITQAGDALKAKKALMQTITPAYNLIMAPKKGVRPPSEEGAKNAVLTINQALSAAGSPWTASYDMTGHWWQTKRPQIVFRDMKGNITKDPTAIISEIPGADTVKARDLIARGQGPTLTPEQSRAAAILRTMNPEQVDSVVQGWYQEDKKHGGDGSSINDILDAIGEP